MSIVLAIWAALRGALSTMVDTLRKLSVCQLVCLILGCLLLLQTVRIEGLKLWPISYHGLKEQVTNARAATAKCQSDRQADRQAYVTAQVQAQAANKAQVQKVEQQYQRNSDNERQAYLDDLAKLRAGRVRPQASAPSGAPGSAGTPAPDAGTPRIDDAGVCVPATSDVCEAGAEIELRLMHLQNLYLGQSQVDPNK